MQGRFNYSDSATGLCQYRATRVQLHSHCLTWNVFPRTGTENSILISAKCIISSWWWYDRRGHPRSGGKFPLSLFAVSPTFPAIFPLWLNLATPLSAFSLFLCLCPRSSPFCLLRLKSLSLSFPISFSFCSVVCSHRLALSFYPCFCCMSVYASLMFCWYASLSVLLTSHSPSQSISLLLSPFTFFPFSFLLSSTLSLSLSLSSASKG